MPLHHKEGKAIKKETEYEHNKVITAKIECP